MGASAPPPPHEHNSGFRAPALAAAPLHTLPPPRTLNRRALLGKRNLNRCLYKVNVVLPENDDADDQVALANMVVDHEVDSDYSDDSSVALENQSNIEIVD